MLNINGVTIDARTITKCLLADEEQKENLAWYGLLPERIYLAASNEICCMEEDADYRVRKTVAQCTDEIWTLRDLSWDENEEVAEVAINRLKTLASQEVGYYISHLKEEEGVEVERENGKIKIIYNNIEVFKHVFHNTAKYDKAYNLLRILKISQNHSLKDNKVIVEINF